MGTRPVAVSSVTILLKWGFLVETPKPGSRAGLRRDLDIHKRPRVVVSVVNRQVRATFPVLGAEPHFESTTLGTNVSFYVIHRVLERPAADAISRKARPVSRPDQLVGRFNCRICSWTSRRSVVENPVAGSRNWVSTGAGAGAVGGGIGDWLVGSRKLWDPWNHILRLPVSG